MRAATSGRGGMSLSTAAVPSCFSRVTSSLIPASASACLALAAARVAAPSVAALSPGGLKAPTSEL